MIVRSRPSLSLRTSPWPLLRHAACVGLALALLTLLSLLAPATAHAQDVPDAPDAPNIVGSISGRVTNEAGEPLAGIEVRTQGATQSYGPVYTDAAGRYRIDGIVTGIYRLSFNDYQGRYAYQYFDGVQNFSAAQTLPVAGNDISGVDVVMTRGAIIRGTVVLTGALLALDPDAAGELRVEYAYYGLDGNEQLYSDMQAFSTLLNTDDNRYGYRFENLLPGVYRLCATLQPVYLEEDVYYQGPPYTECYDDSLTFDAASNVETSAGRTARNIDITLGDSDDYATLTGVVTGFDGEPRSGITVELYQEQEENAFNHYPYPDYGYRNFSVRTDAQGVYTVSTLQPDTYRLAFVDQRAIDFADTRLRHLPQFYKGRRNLESATPIEVAERETLQINAQLEVGGAITGVIELGQGYRADDPYYGGYINVNLESADGGVIYSASTIDVVEEENVARYRFDAIPPGRYYVQAASYPFIKYYPNQPSLESATPILVEAAGITRDVDFTDLSKGPEDGAITGRATVANGDPAANVPVGLYATEPSTYSFNLLYLATTDRQGRYRLSTPSSGSYRVCFGLDLTPLPEYQYGCYAGSNESTGNNGEAEAISVPSGETVEGVDLRVQRHTQIRGRVQTEDGQGVGYGSVLIFQRSGDSETAGWMQINSAPIINPFGEPVKTYGLNLAPGTYRLGVQVYTVYGEQTIFYPDATSFDEAETITLVNGGQRNIDFILPDPADASLSGTVTRDGEPLAGIRVELYRRNDYYGGYYGEPTPLIYTTTDANGHYEIRGLFTDFYIIRFVDPAGELTPRWYGGGFSLNSATPVELADGEARGTVNVQMGRFAFYYLPVVGR